MQLNSSESADECDEEIKEILKEIHELEIEIQDLLGGITIVNSFAWTWAVIDFYFDLQDLRAIAAFLNTELAAAIGAGVLGSIVIISAWLWLFVIHPDQVKLKELKKKLEKLNRKIKKIKELESKNSIPSAGNGASGGATV